MGLVAAADDLLLGREVALKVLHPHMLESAEAVARFKSEARSLARLNNPHIVRVLDYGIVQSPATSAGLPFMVLELLHGEDLYALASREGPLEPGRAVRYVRQACTGLMSAHESGIVHRDLKPENLFLALEGDGQERLKVLDFGIARSHNRRVLTRANLGVGSPGYMAPEQVQGADVVGVQADIWALGVVLYELLSHRPAFQGDSPEAICAQTLAAPVTPLAELRPDLPRPLLDIVARCLERTPERRYASVTELAAALEPFDDRNRPPAPPIATAPTATWAAEPAAPTLERVSSGDGVELVETKPPVRRARRAAAWLLAILIFAPSAALVPRALRAPELARVRVWSEHTLLQAEHEWQRARDWAKGLVPR